MTMETNETEGYLEGIGASTGIVAGAITGAAAGLLAGAPGMVVGGSTGAAVGAAIGVMGDIAGRMLEILTVFTYSVLKAALNVEDRP